jgi:polyhydroxybutyrate depolymerase
VATWCLDKLSVSVLVCQLLAAAAAPAAVAQTPPSTQQSLNVAGAARDYRLFRPAGVASKPAPVVIMLHGALGTSSQIEEWLGLSAVAARENFAVVYPQGVGRSWNDARAAKFRMLTNSSAADDVAFLDRLTDDLIAKGIADPKRVYIAGLSNGGFMTMRMACEKSGKYAAFASVIASAPLSISATCKPPRPLPMLMINGTADTLVKFDAKGAAEQGNFGAAELAKFWADRNGCGAATETALPDVDAGDKSTVTARRYSGCKANAGVELLTIRNGGHQPPARGNQRDYKLMAFMLGARNHDLDTAESFWAFFKQHTR